MGLNISLIVHGVPYGHKIWGASESETQYIATFYGPTYDVDEQMVVERFANDGGAYIYYTFVRGKNVLDSDGRPGSYFALTLRMDAYYADIQNMYNILSAAYRKSLVGECVSENEGHAKFVISDFTQADKKLKEVEAHIKDYIGYFSNQNDLQSLSAFKQTANGSAKSVNLSDCEAKEAIRLVQSGARLAVSPLFPSTQMEKALAQMRQELTAAQQQIVTAQQQAADAQQKTDAAKQHATQLQGQMRQREQEMKQQIRSFQQENKTLKRQMDDEKQATNSLENEVREYKENVGRLEEILNKIAEAISGYRTGHTQGHKRPGDNQRSPYTGGETPPIIDYNPPRGLFSRIPDILKHGIMVLLMLVVIVMGACQIVSQKQTERSLKELKEAAMSQQDTKDKEDAVRQLSIIGGDALLSVGETYQVPVKQAAALKWDASDPAVAKVEETTKEGVKLRTQKKGSFSLTASLDGKKILSLDCKVEE